MARVTLDHIVYHFADEEAVNMFFLGARHATINWAIIKDGHHFVGKSTMRSLTAELERLDQEKERALAFIYKERVVKGE